MNDPKLKRFEVHRQVCAMKIDRIEIPADGAESATGKAFLVGQGNSCEHQVAIDADFVNLYSPAVGGYFVEALNGDRSYLSAEAFESGYREI